MYFIDYVHFVFFCWDKKVLVFFYLTCFGVHCCLPQSAVVALPWRVLSAGDGLIMWSVTPAASSITRWSLEERDPGLCEHKSSFVPVDGLLYPSLVFMGFWSNYCWVFQSIMWFSCLQWSEMADFKFSWFAFSFSPHVSQVAICFSLSFWCSFLHVLKVLPVSSMYVLFQVLFHLLFYWILILMAIDLNWTYYWKILLFFCFHLIITNQQ